MDFIKYHITPRINEHFLHQQMGRILILQHQIQVEKRRLDYYNYHLSRVKKNKDRVKLVIRAAACISNMTQSMTCYSVLANDMKELILPKTIEKPVVRIGDTDSFITLPNQKLLN